MRRAFSLVEVLMGSAIGLILIALCWQWLTGSTRILSRGQNKMQDTNQAELIFRWIDQDVHTSATSPLIESGGAKLVISRYVDPDGPDPLIQRKITWTFQPGVDGAGSFVERAPEAAPGQRAIPPTRFAVGTLTASVVRPAGPPERPGLTVRLTMKQPEDATVAVFSETFTYQNQITDPRWNPIPRPTP